MAGMTSRVSRVELTMPPIIGTAMRCMTSEPVPVLHRIGSRPAMIAVTVIILGRTRSTAPSTIAALRSARVNGRPSAAQMRVPLFQRLIEIDQHHHAGLGGDAGQRDEAHGDGHAHVEAHPPHEPQPADQREGQRQHDDQRLGDAAGS